jgi:hypothetical protein
LKNAKYHFKHYINVLKHDAIANSYHIIDSNFDINNYINGENLQKAYTAIEHRHIFMFELLAQDNSVVEILRILYEHLLWGIKSDLLINSRVYKANACAVSSYASEFESMVKILETSVEKYVPQFMSYPLIGYGHMIKGNYYLYNYIATKYNLNFLSHLVEISKEYYDNWMIYDAKLDKSFIKGDRIHDQINGYNDLLQRISVLAVSLQSETYRCLDYISKTYKIDESLDLVNK